MPQTAIWIVVGLFAILVAAAVATLLQLRTTLATANRTMDSTGRRVDQALDELTTTLDRVNRAAGELERGTQRVAALFEVLGGLGESLVKIRSSIGSVLTIGAAVGPMLVAAVRALLRDSDGPRGDPEDAPAARAVHAEVER